RRTATTYRTSPPIMQNIGQYDESIRFRLDVRGASLLFYDDAIGLVARRTAPASDQANENTSDWTYLRLSFTGANAGVHPQAFGQANAHVSYFIGNDPSQWRSDVPVWSGVRYQDLYPGI